jgi:hypothetical protein
MTEGRTGDRKRPVGGAVLLLAASQLGLGVWMAAALAFGLLLAAVGRRGTP